MTKELAIYQEPTTGLSLPQLGEVLSKSGYFQDTKDAAQAIVKVLAGQELGIGPIAAMTGVYVVNGRVAIGANLMAAAVKRSGRYNYRVLEMTDDACAVAFFEQGEQIGVSRFTLADAKKAQTKNLDKFPRNMLFARAMSNGVRWYCPDVFSTAVYTPDELGGTLPPADEPPPVLRRAEPVIEQEPPRVEPGASYEPPNERDDPTLARTRVREQIKALSAVTGDALAELVKLPIGDMELRHLDALSIEIEKIHSAYLKGELTPLAVATTLKLRGEASKAVASRLAEQLANSPKAA